MEEQVASGIINSTPSLKINRKLLEEIYKMDDPNLKASKMFDFWQAFIREPKRIHNQSPGYEVL